MRKRFVLVLALALWLCPPATSPAHADAHGQDTSAGALRSKKGKKRAKNKKEQATAPPEWQWSGGPFTHFAWLARQMPDFARFPKRTREIRLSIVAHRNKALLFLDSCLAKEKGGQWQVSKCNAVSLDDKQFLARLVKAGTDTAGDRGSLNDLQEFLVKIRKTAKREHLLPLLLEASVENEEAYRLLDDIDADIKECGKRPYFKALGSLPKATFIGTNVVVVDLSYTVEKGKSSFKLKASLAKTKKGWRIGGLQVKCF